MSEKKSMSANIFQAKGYSDKAAEEITRAINALSIHGVLQVRQKDILKTHGKLWKSFSHTSMSESSKKWIQTYYLTN
jgi:hypothetical protein